MGSRVGTAPVLDDLRHHYKLTFEVASVNPGSPLLENKSRGSRTPPATRYTVQPLLRVSVVADLGAVFLVITA